MTRLLTLFTTSLAVGFSGAMMPGPLLTAVIKESAQWGSWAGPLVIVGHGLAELGVIIALAKGLGSFLKRNSVAGLVGLLGGIVLIWMGYDISLSAWHGLISFGIGSSQTGGTERLSPIAAGLLATLSNPYWVIWWATIGAGYTALSLKEGKVGLGAFFTGHILSDFSWYSLVSFVVATGSRIFSQTVYQAVLFVCGLFLIAMSVYFIHSGLGFLRGRRTIEQIGR